MIIDKCILDDLTAKAKASPRLRMNLDLRNSAEGKSQRMLNDIEPGPLGIIHRHTKTTETIAILRGHLQEYYYNEDGTLQSVFDLAPGGPIVALSVPIGQWYSARALASGTVILSCKDGAYEPLGQEDILDYTL